MDLSFNFFEALRRMKARPDPMTPVASINPQPVRSVAIQPAMRVQTSSIGPQGLALIKQFEGCARARKDGRFEAYPDPASSLSRTGSGSGAPWTIGWGATGAGVIWTRDQCDARLARDLERFARDVAKAIGPAPTTQGQFDAMVSFHYNTGAIARASLTRLHIAGRFGDAADEFGKWVNAAGKRLPGLVRRRAAEAKLYVGGTSAWSTQ